MIIHQLKLRLIALPRFIKRAIAITFDVLINFFVSWATFGLLSNEWGIFKTDLLVFTAFSIIFSIPIFIAFGLYRAIFRYIGALAFLSLMRAFVIYTVLIFILFTLMGVDGVSRSAGVVQPALLFILIGLSRLIIRAWLAFSDGSHQNLGKDIKPRVLIYGAGSAGRQLAASLRISKEVYVKGFIDDSVELQGHLVNGIHVYRASELETLIPQLKITDIFLAIPSVKVSIKNQIITNLSSLGVRVRKLPGLMDLVSGQVKASDLHELDMNELLGREVVPPDISLLALSVSDKRVVVTGAGGSIGSELCRQILKFSPKSLTLIDISEHALYLIDSELRKCVSQSENITFQEKVNSDRSHPPIPTSPITITSYLASVNNNELLLKIFKAEQPDVVFHAAAYKHVPLVEANPAEGIRNNVFGTLSCAKVSLASNVSNFVLVSTDKAVRPTNIMGASKRISELIIQALANEVTNKSGTTIFSMVRFGNVLGSSGSVAPLFSSQIKLGGPLTLTHLDVTRYFMTLEEAAQLVIQANALAKGGDLFVLDMGDPVRIFDLAVRMIYLSGFVPKDMSNPDGDIEIISTGLRPGEKLYEELLIGDNPEKTVHSKIMRAHEDFIFWSDLEHKLEKLFTELSANNLNGIVKLLTNLVSGYTFEDKIKSVD
jgi:FlaA1/EpsC-like NDP-sugar epimerase